MLVLGFHSSKAHFLVEQNYSGLPWQFSGKESACNAGELDSIPGLGRSPGKGVAPHSSTLAWRIPWTKEASSLQSMGLQRVGHD